MKENLIQNGNNTICGKIPNLKKKNDDNKDPFHNYHQKNITYMHGSSFNVSLHFSTTLVCNPDPK